MSILSWTSGRGGRDGKGGTDCWHCRWDRRTFWNNRHACTRRVYGGMQVPRGGLAEGGDCVLYMFTRRSGQSVCVQSDCVWLLTYVRRSAWPFTFGLVCRIANAITIAGMFWCPAQAICYDVLHKRCVLVFLSYFDIPFELGWTGGVFGLTKFSASLVVCAWRRRRHQMSRSAEVARNTCVHSYLGLRVCNVWWKRVFIASEECVHAG